MRIVTELPNQVEILEHVEIPMTDGTLLSARMWRPKNCLKRPVPALLEYIPYRKRDRTRRRDSINAPYLAGHGYAYIRVDIRGCGDSEGHILDQYSEAELSDGVEIIRWLSEQPWCDGAVGMIGISWGGFNALQIAARQPAALGAIVTVCSTDDTYQDNMHYLGGCLLSDNLSEATTMFGYQSLPPDPEIVGERWKDMWQERLDNCYPWLIPWLENQWKSDYWHQTSVNTDYSAIRCPVLAASGWADGFTNAVFRLMEHLEVPRRGLIGPWRHLWPHLGDPGPAIGFLQVVVDWFDHYLKGKPMAQPESPRLTVWMQDSIQPQFAAHRERPGKWVVEKEWPSSSIQTKTLYFSPYRLGEEPSKEAEETRTDLKSPLSVGLYAGKWCSYAGAPDLPGDQREEDGGSLFFQTPPLEKAVEILGTPRVHLRVSSDRPVAQVAVRLSDVLPDGSVNRVSYGVANLTHRNSHSEPEALVQNEPVDVCVPLKGLAQRFPAGNRIRVSVSTSYWPLIWPAPDPFTLSLYLAGCRLELPERPVDSGPLTEPFEPAEGTEPMPVTMIQSPRVKWRVVRDLEFNRSTLEVVRHDSHQRLDEIDLEMRDYTLEHYSSQNNDISTVRGETITEREFQRADWHTRVKTRTVLTSDKDDFHLHATLDAYEGQERVFSQTWTRRIPRRLV